jgi:hypothetical protein
LPTTGSLCVFYDTLVTENSGEVISGDFGLHPLDSD